MISPVAASTTSRGQHAARQLRQAQIAPRRLDQVVDPDAQLGAAVVLVDDDVLRRRRSGAASGSPSPPFACAVSARPLRAPWVDRKYSSTVSPSRNDERIGSSMMRPDGSAIRPRMPAICEICWMLPLAPDWAIIAHRAVRVEHLADRLGDLVLGLGPDLDDLVVALVIGDQTAAIVLLDALDLFVGLCEDPSFSVGMVMSAMAIVMPDCVA